VVLFQKRGLNKRAMPSFGISLICVPELNSWLHMETFGVWKFYFDVTQR
jgi:hypothetical protein